MVVKIVPNDNGNPPGKLADAELHFTDGVLDGLKLIGFAVWERRRGGGRNVTFRRASSRSTVSAAASRCCARSLTQRHRSACVISCCRRTPSTRRQPLRPLRSGERQGPGCPPTGGRRESPGERSWKHPL